MVRADTHLLIVGAGPFGLAMAAHARSLGIDHAIVGEPMAFWRRHMPPGMILRSAGDWHLDPSNTWTIERFLETRGLERIDAEPLPLDLYLEYARWFEERAGLEVARVRLQALHVEDGGAPRFRAELEGGDSITAETVLVALGFRHFAHVPTELAEGLPRGRCSHTCDFVDFRALEGRRCLIVGGRQSAFEWAALIAEAGAASVDVAHRHDSPRFAVSDWSWVDPLIARFETEPGWYRRLSPAEQEAVKQRLFAEGRLKVEPWLESRCASSGIRIRPRAQIVSAAERPEGDIEVRLDDGESLVVDHVVLATGYKPDVTRVPFLARGNLLPRLAVRNGCPVLDDSLQTSVPGLFATSMLATHDFGPFFGFTVAVRTSARLVARGLA